MLFREMIDVDRSTTTKDINYIVGAECRALALSLPLVAGALEALMPIFMHFSYAVHSNPCRSVGTCACFGDTQLIATHMAE